MELRDYLRMLRRGWPVVMLIVALFIGAASIYVALVPKSYESTTVLFISANDPQTVTDLQQSSQFSTKAVNTYATIIDSSTVLGPVASQLRPQSDVDSLAAAVWTVVPSETTLINITASANNPERAAAIANAVATSAMQVLPALESAADGRPLVRVQQTLRAVEPIVAVSPNVRNILALSLIVGLCLGLGTTIAFQALDTKIQRMDDLRHFTEVPLLAVLPRVGRAQRHSLAVRDEPGGVAGEAFRALRTNLRFIESKDRRSLVFAPVSDDRNGAQVPANLAWSLVQAGRRVLLADLDLRQSAVGSVLGLPVTSGMAEVLSGETDLANVVRDTGHPGLKVILSGTAQASPSDLLSASALSSVLRRVEQEYDYVILHVPPLLSYTDAAIVAGTAGVTFVTVTAGRTRVPELSAALGTLGNVWVKPSGLVLEGIRRPKGPGTAAAVEPRRQHVTHASASQRRPSSAPAPRPAPRPTPTGLHGSGVSGYHAPHSANGQAPPVRPRPQA